MEKMERAGCQSRSSGWWFRPAIRFNLDGTNIYMTLAALFIAQATGIDLSLRRADLLLLAWRCCQLQGRGRHDRRGLHHPGRDAVGGADRCRWPAWR